MLEKIKDGWSYVQDLLDVRGDVIMLAMSCVFTARVALSAFGKPPLTVAEAALYSSAIAAFAYSNKGPKNS